MTRIVEFIFFKAAIFTSRWLKKNARRRWDLVAMQYIKNETSDMHRSVSSVYKANKTTGLESLSGIAFPGDKQCHVNSSISLPDWAKEIQPFLHNQLSEHTRRAYETDLKHFFGFLEGKIAPHELRSLKADHIILYRKFLEEGRLTGKSFEKSTVNRKLAVVKSFLNWLKLNRLIQDNPAQLVKGYPQSQESALKGLSDEEVRKILSIPKRNTHAGATHLAILHVLMYLGVRKSELLDLKMGDLAEERGVPVLKVRGKGHRIRILPVTPQVRSSLEHYFWVCRRDKTATTDPLFTPTKNPKSGMLLKRMNPNAINYIVIHYAKKAGILKKISPHSCRATCISNALDRKATHRSVQSLAGWTTPLMIQRYDKRREDLKNSAAFLVDYGENEPEAAALTQH